MKWVYPSSPAIISDSIVPLKNIALRAKNAGMRVRVCALCKRSYCHHSMSLQILTLLNCNIFPGRLTLNYCVYYHSFLRIAFFLSFCTQNVKKEGLQYSILVSLFFRYFIIYIHMYIWLITIGASSLKLYFWPLEKSFLYEVTLFVCNLCVRMNSFLFLPYFSVWIVASRKYFLNFFRKIFGVCSNYNFIHPTIWMMQFQCFKNLIDRFMRLSRYGKSLPWSFWWKGEFASQGP